MTIIKRKEAFPSLLNEFFDQDWFNMNNGINGGSSIPAVNIKENDNGFLIELAAPGMKKEDFKVNLDHKVLSISSESKSESKSEEGKYSRQEFNYQSFKRSFTLPESVETDKIEATYENGVLRLNIPKKDEAKPQPSRLIEIG